MNDPISYLRPEVLAFAIAMERELRANDHKGGWKGCHPIELVNHLNDEVKELAVEIRKGTSAEVLSEAADVLGGLELADENV